MEEDNEDPSQISRLAKNTMITNIVYLNKKRKYQEEQLGLPLPKHKCFERVLSSECDSLLNQGPENEGIQTCMIYEDTEKETSDDGSGLDSAKDSNSFITDSDSATSVYGETKFRSIFAKTSTHDRPSTSSGNWGSTSFQNTVFSLDKRIETDMGAGAGKEELAYMVVGQQPNHKNSKLQEYYHLQEHPHEFEDLVNYSCLEYGNDIIEQCKDEDLDEMPDDGVNPNVYVLSSGRWSVNREDQPGTKKPTIDQEFEQYFSSLMLQ